MFSIFKLLSPYNYIEIVIFRHYTLCIPIVSMNVFLKNRYKTKQKTNMALLYSDHNENEICHSTCSDSDDSTLL